MKKSRLIILFLIAIVAATIGITPPYVFTALKNGEPGIEDYKIFENRTIKANNPIPWKMAQDYNSFRMHDTINAKMEEMGTIAYLVVQDTAIKYEAYWDGFDATSLSNSFSAAKSVVSLLIGMALDEGKIKSLDQKVGDFLPSFKNGRKFEISIRDMLTMSSGLNWDEQYTTPFSMTTEAYYGTDLEQLINRLEVVSKPGKEFNYLSGDTEVLAMIVQAATGERISDYATRKLWAPMGAEVDAKWSLDREDGMEKAYCCFNSNARDFARFGQLVLNKGKWNGEQLISEAYLSEATSAADYLTDMETGKTLDFYGYQWWIVNYKGYSIPFMRGILGQYIFAIKEKNAVVVRLGHKRSTEYIGAHPRDVYEYLDAAFLLLD